MAPRPETPTSPVTLLDRVRDLAALVTTPLLPQDYLDLIDPLRVDLHAARTHRRAAARDPRRRHRRDPPRRAAGAGTVPGQYVRLGVDVDGVRQWRTYSLTWPADRADGCIAITVKAIPDGVVSNHLVRRARVGTARPPRPGLPATSSCRTSRPAKVAVRHRRQRHHPGHGHAAQRRSTSSTTSSSCTRRRRRPTSSSAASCGCSPARGRIRLVERHTDDRRQARRRRSSLELVPDLAERETWACGPDGSARRGRGACAPTAGSARSPAHRALPAPVLRATGDGGTVTFTAQRHRRRRRRRARRCSTPARPPAC